MTTDEIMNLEMDGLRKTIKGYCRDNYIISYTNKLQELKYPKDKNYIKIIASRLLSWYEEVLPSIEESKFVTNKKEHYKSINILKELLSQLD